MLPPQALAGVVNPLPVLKAHVTCGVRMVHLCGASLGLRPSGPRLFLVTMWTGGEETKGTRYPGLRGGTSPVGSTGAAGVGGLRLVSCLVRVLVQSSCWILFVLVGTPSMLRPVQAVDPGNRGDQPRADDDDRQTLAGCGGHFNIWTTDLLLPKSRVLFGIKFRLFSASV